MPGLIIDGREHQVFGITIENYYDIPGLEIKAPEDGKARTSPPMGVLLHTTKGIPGGKDLRPQVLHPGIGPNTKAGITMATWCRTNVSRTSIHGGHHLTIDQDGLVSCHADLSKWSLYHGHTVNNATVGIEIKQGGDAGLYQIQMDVLVKLVDALTRLLKIQRQIPDKYRGPILHRFGPGKNGRDFSGVYGHRDVTGQRGAGDPGDFVFDALAQAGYERFNLDAKEDLKVWSARQKQWGLGSDGIPGAKTRSRLVAEGYKHGLWIPRPGD